MRENGGDQEAGRYYSTTRYIQTSDTRHVLADRLRLEWSANCVYLILGQFITRTTVTNQRINCVTFELYLVNFPESLITLILRFTSCRSTISLNVVSYAKLCPNTPSVLSHYFNSLITRFYVSFLPRVPSHVRWGGGDERYGDSSPCFLSHKSPLPHQATCIRWALTPHPRTSACL